MESLRPTWNPKEVEITVVSAKHLKNVNWRRGDLKPYVVIYLDPDRRVATKPDNSFSTNPVWNERFTLPLHRSFKDSILTVEIFHSKPSKPSETSNPLVGTARSLLDELHPDVCRSAVVTLEVHRPSGRPHGKILLKYSLPDPPSPPPVPDYHTVPPSGYYYSTAPPPPSPPPASVRDYRSFSPPPIPSQPSHYPYGNYSDPYSGYCSSTGYSLAAPPPARPSYEGASGYGWPSAPVDYSSGSASSYEHKAKGGKLGMGAGLAVGAVAGALGGLALEEGLKHGEGKIAERVESDLAPRDDYYDYRNDY